MEREETKLGERREAVEGEKRGKRVRDQRWRMQREKERRP